MHLPTNQLISFDKVLIMKILMKTLEILMETLLATYLQLGGN